MWHYISAILEKAFTAQLRILRDQVPAGIQHALQLLKETNGDIDAAILLYKRDAISRVCTETTCTPEIAEQYLLKHHFDIAMAIQQLLQDQEDAIPLAKDKIPPKLMRLLMKGKSSSYPGGGKLVGTRVNPSSKNPNNKAWISISSIVGLDFSSEISRYCFQNFEVEYLELNEEYESCWNADYDFYLVKREIYYHIKTEAELEDLLFTWLSDLSLLTYIRSSGHPEY